MTVTKQRPRISGDPSLPLWSVWFVPTQKGTDAFGWRAKRMGDPFRATRDEAMLEVHLQAADWQVPDRHEYGRYELRAELGMPLQKGNCAP